VVVIIFIGWLYYREWRLGRQYRRFVERKRRKINKA
jgi:hypothetical protein